MSNYALDWAIQQPLKAPAKPVLFNLANRANGSHECWPSLDRIAFETGLSKSSVKKALKQLRQEGYLTITPRKRDGGGSASNGYRLFLPESSQTPGRQMTGATSRPREGASESLPGGATRPGEGAPHDPKPKEGTLIETKDEPRVFIERIGRREGLVEVI